MTTTHPSTAKAPRGNARGKLVAAAQRTVRRKGYAATSVDEICVAAGVTKGAFFHPFVSKEALAVDAAESWTASARPMRSEEHTSDLQSLMRISYATVCSKKNNTIDHTYEMSLIDLRLIFIPTH